MIKIVYVHLEEAVVDERDGKVGGGDGKGQEQVRYLLVLPCP